MLRKAVFFPRKFYFDIFIDSIDHNHAFDSFYFNFEKCNDTLGFLGRYLSRVQDGSVTMKVAAGGEIKV